MDSDSIYALLLREVQWGELPPGLLKENDVAARFGVSRTPVRDVLNRLVHDRVLVRTPKGLLPREITPEEIIQIYDMRILLEAEAASQAAKNRHVTDIVSLKGLLQRDRSLKSPDNNTRTQTNIEFHEAIWKAAHNNVLSDLLDRLALHAIHKPSSTLTLGTRWEESLDEHEAMIQSIEAQQSDEASSIMESHMRTARELRLSMFGQFA